MEYIIDSELGKILGISTKRVNEIFKRNSFDLDEKQFRVKGPRQQFRPINKPSYLYNFKGVSLLISRIRKILSSDVRGRILSYFKEKEFIVLDDGLGKFHPMTVQRVKKILNGIVDFKEEFEVDIGNEKYLVDLYVPDCCIGIEIDGNNHKYYTNDELNKIKFLHEKGLRTKTISLLFTANSEEDFLILLTKSVLKLKKLSKKVTRILF